MFPDTDERWRGADSRVLLRRRWRAVRAAGWRVGNVDATVVAQAPKIAPHVAAMAANIAADLGIDAGAVNVKGKTTSGSASKGGRKASRRRRWRCWSVADSHRLFFAVWPDEAAAQALHETAREAQRICGGRLMRRETLHLTLAFLGEIPAARFVDATAVAADIGFDAFTLTLDQLAYWKHNRIVWAGGDSAPLAALATALGDGLCGPRASGSRSRPFVAHMTLLRDARCPAAPPLAGADRLAGAGVHARRIDADRQRPAVRDRRYAGYRSGTNPAVSPDGFAREASREGRARSSALRKR